MSPKAWANFTQSGSQSLSQSSGVSSITDLGTGLSRLTWSTAFTATTYGYTVGQLDPGAQRGAWMGRNQGSTKATTTLDINCTVFNDSNFGSADSTDATVVAFGAQ